MGMTVGGGLRGIPVGKYGAEGKTWLAFGVGFGFAVVGFGARGVRLTVSREYRSIAVRRP